jgi:hypothetical protein
MTTPVSGLSARLLTKKRAGGQETVVLPNRPYETRPRRDGRLAHESVSSYQVR